jgi:DNA-directed RNA polymerase specialized sigma24 family protein
LDEEALEQLVTRSCNGDRRAWGELWLALAPMVEQVARCPRITGRLSRCEDTRSEVVVRVMAELREDGFRRLADLGACLARRDGSFRRWIWKVARNVAVSHVRANLRWTEYEPLSEEMEDDRFPTERQVEAHGILARSRVELDPGQQEALDRWLQGDADHDARLRRSAVARLRHLFGSKKIDRCV